MMDRHILSQVEKLLGYKFSDRKLLIESLTHSSYASDRLKSNERLEFLGDSVLALVICQTLFDQFPDYFEGDLTKIKSRLVSRKVCSKLTNELGLTEFIRVGKGMSKTRAMSGSIAAGTFESIIAAIYLDGGYAPAKTFLQNAFASLIEKTDADHHHENFKSVLQQHSQQTFGVTPVYELLDEKGPDHDKCFETAVIIGHRRFPSAWGVTKKDAEQKAAQNVLVELGLVNSEE